MTSPDFTDAHLEAVARINAAGFRARLVQANGSISLQVKVLTGDRRIEWDQHPCHVTPIVAGQGQDVVWVFAPRGFEFVHVGNSTTLSHAIRCDEDALMFAHFFEQPHRITGPRCLNRQQLHDLRSSVAATA